VLRYQILKENSTLQLEDQIVEERGPQEANEFAENVSLAGLLEFAKCRLFRCFVPEVVASQQNAFVNRKFFCYL
jgi:hypothetical protein